MLNSAMPMLFKSKLTCNIIAMYNSVHDHIGNQSNNSIHFKSNQLISQLCVVHVLLINVCNITFVQIII